MLRPAVLAEYSAPQSPSARVRAFKVLTWVATLGCGMFGVFGTTYKGGRNGEHALSRVQAYGRSVYESSLATLGLTPPGGKQPPLA